MRHQQKHMRAFKGVATKGFTHFQTVVVMMLLSITALAIINLQGNVFKGHPSNKDLQVGVQLLQQCAEQIISVRRKLGYDAVTNSTCNSLGNYGGFGPLIVTLTKHSGPACPASGICKNAEISLSKGGTSLTSVTLELVKY